LRLENTTVIIEPRTVGACLDLAVLFCRRHALALLPPTLCFAAAGALLASLLVSRSEAGAAWSALVYFAASPLLGAIVVTGAGHAVFGAPFAPLAALRAEGVRLMGFLLRALAGRLLIGLAGLACFFVPSLPVAVYGGFLPEVYLLERTGARRGRNRLWELMRGNYLDLLGRAVVLIGFAAGATLTLFVLVDQSLQVLFGWPLLLGRLSRRGDAGEMWRLLVTEPAAAGVLVGLAWLVYPMARLAWFFCYLDVRIRKEAWDLELDFRLEAQRLERLA
jgi:hypothetical protein